MYRKIIFEKKVILFFTTYIASNICTHIAAGPEPIVPPPFSARAYLGLLTCLFPASPRNCVTSS
jgi:hypothetical protein